MYIYINYITVIVAAVVAFLLGWLWHGPIFGKYWMELTGHKKDDMSADKNAVGMTTAMLLALVANLVVAFVVGYLVSALQINGWINALIFSILIWVGFIVTTLLNSVLWERKSWSVYFFNIIYQFFYIFVMVLIFSLW